LIALEPHNGIRRFRQFGTDEVCQCVQHSYAISSHDSGVAASISRAACLPMTAS
jgi:hypothetical protein